MNLRRIAIFLSLCMLAPAADCALPAGPPDGETDCFRLAGHSSEILDTPF
jgi:hypothetical protein